MLYINIYSMKFHLVKIIIFLVEFNKIIRILNIREIHYYAHKDLIKYSIKLL